MACGAARGRSVSSVLQESNAGGAEQYAAKGEIAMAQSRIDKLLASTGRWSRREVKQLIKEGRVLAGAEIVSGPECKYDPQQVELRVDGETICLSTYHYVMLHKPAGVLSATEDRRAQTALDLLAPELQKLGLFPVGRLDKDTEGLLLMTDDGDLAHALLSPKRHVDKVYYVRADGPLDEADAAAFAAGMTLADGFRCLPAKLEILSSGLQSEALITLREGKFHQIKRMLAARNAPVLYLKRLSMGPLRLDETLKRGKWRYLTNSEIDALCALKNPEKV